jgi:hypothetical protein
VCAPRTPNSLNGWKIIERECRLLEQARGVRQSDLGGKSPITAPASNARRIIYIECGAIDEVIWGEKALVGASGIIVPIDDKEYSVLS